MSATSPLSSEIPRDELVRRCREQTARFWSKLKHDPSFCYELFRRALCDRCERAWSAIYAQYLSLVRSWVGTDFRVRGAMLERDDVVNAAFVRFWQAITDENFEQFKTLNALLRYLQRCTVTALLDMSRRKDIENTELDERSAGDSADDVEDEVLTSLSSLALWDYILSRLNDPIEKHLILSSYAYGLTPAELVERWPEMFPDNATVYRIKERILKRLLRDDRLGGFFDANV